MRRYTLAAVAALLVLMPWHDAVRATAPLYTVQDLGNFNGLAVTVTGMNASGQVVGNATTDSTSQAVRYTPNMGWQALNGLGSDVFSLAAGINDSGDVVGSVATAAGVFAFRYTDIAGVQQIAAPAGGTQSLGLAIDNNGTVVGAAVSQIGLMVPFRADVGMPSVELPSLGGGQAQACGINAAGQIAGTSLDASGFNQHGTLLNPGAMSPTEIVSLYGPEFTVTVCAIDAQGRVAGQTEVGAGVVHAFRYTDNSATGRLDLDTFGSIKSNVESISEGLSVGWYTLADSSTHAFTHRDGDGSVDLNTRISDATWVLSTAKAVNKNGAIAGEGLLNGVATTYVATPATADTVPPAVTISASPSSIPLPTGQLVNVLLKIDGTDNSGQAPVCSLRNIAGGAPGDATVTGQFTASVRAVAGVTYTFTGICTDAANNVGQASVGVTVGTDTTAPHISSVSASPSSISPADDSLVNVTVTVSATDDVTNPPSCSVSGVTGGAAGNAAVTGPLTVRVRAASAANYTISVSCADAAGNTSNGATSVSVVTAPPPPPPPTDTKPPVIKFLHAKRTDIRLNGVPWEAIKLFVYAQDNVDKTPTCSITSITGGPAGSFAITGPLTARVRAQKSAGDFKRFYMLHVSCVDDAGASGDDDGDADDIGPDQVVVL